MARKINTTAVVYNVRLKEQVAKIVAVDAGYAGLYAKSTGLFLEDSNEVELGPLGISFDPGGRLTLTAGTPVTMVDVTGAATLYYTPYKHDMISLFDGTKWIPVPFTEKSLSLVGYTASKPYDIWGYLSGGTLALESTIWTDATTRATALAYQNGRLVKSGTATRLYLGTIYINGSGGQTDDALLTRYVWNYYNRKSRHMIIVDANSHSYTTSSYRAWNNDSNVNIKFIVGVVDETMLFTIASDLESAAVAIGVDSTTATRLAGSVVKEQYTSTGQMSGTGIWVPSLGYHYIQAQEYGFAGATQVTVLLQGMING